MRSTHITLSTTKARTSEAIRPLTLILATPRPPRSARGMERSASHEPYRSPGELSSKPVSFCLNPATHGIVSGRSSCRVYPVHSLVPIDFGFLWPNRVPAELSFDSQSVIVEIQGGLDVDFEINLRDGCR